MIGSDNLVINVDTTLVISKKVCLRIENSSYPGQTIITNSFFINVIGICRDIFTTKNIVD